MTYNVFGGTLNPAQLNNSDGFQDVKPQIFLCHDLDLLQSRDIIYHSTRNICGQFGSALTVISGEVS